MNPTVNRRHFLKTTGALGATVAISGTPWGRLLAAEAAPNAAAAKKLGWSLCCAAWTFNQLTFFETIDKVQALGLDAIEGFNWQRLSVDKPDVKINAAMSAADRKETRQRLADAGIHMNVCYINALDNEATVRKTFEWVKDLGVGTVVAEPPKDAYDMIEPLCDEYEINLAIHNHPAPSPYFDPATVVAICQGRGKRIGCCADTGHWVRSGFGPVEALRKLEGRVLSFHLKDTDAVGVVESPCVPWGQGKGSIAAIMAEAKRQNFQGTFSIEYEPYAPENFEAAQACIAFFNKTAAELAG